MLEDPFETDAWAHLPAISSTEIVGNLDLTSKVEVGSVEKLSDAVPELRLGQDHTL